MAKPAESDFPLLKYIDGLMDNLREHVPQALKQWDEEAIHDARVSTRRLKAAIDLMELVLSKGQRKPFAKVLKKLRRRLGPLRDLDVMIDHLDKLSEDFAHREAVTWLKSHLQERRERERTQSQKKHTAAQVLGKLGTWWGVREEVAEAREAMDSLLAESLHLQLDAFAEQATRLLANGSSKAPEAGSMDGQSPHQDPHELRIAGKELRYTLEMAGVQGHKLPPAVMKIFKQMQEALGLWHDYVVLTECTMDLSLERQLPHHDAALQAQVIDVARLFLRRASKHLDHFSDLWQKRGDELARTIRERFPLTRRISESKTDPDLTDLPDTPAPAALPPDVASTA